MIITIEKVGNGYILRYGEDMKDVLLVEIQDNSDGGEVEAFRSLLWEINEVFGPSTSRHSEKRISIDVVPGDKHISAKEESEDEECN